jgi:hypothetical protein
MMMLATISASVQTASEPTSVAPAWAVLPLAFVTLIVVAVHWVALGQADMPRWRKSIRTANGLVMMLTIPVLAYGFGVVSPQNQRHFILTWVLATGLMSLVMLLALADVLNSWYVLWRARRVMMRRAAKARQLLLKQVVEEGHEASNASVS